AHPQLTGLALGTELTGVLVDDGDLVARGHMAHRPRGEALRGLAGDAVRDCLGHAVRGIHVEPDHAAAIGHDQAEAADAQGPVRLAQIALACVCTTAFGRLVVPDVNMIPNGNIGSAGRGVQSSASPESPSKVSKPWAASSAVAGSPLLSAVTAIHFSAGAAA